MDEQEKLIKDKENNFEDVATIKSTDILYICGGRETGKSYFMKKLAKAYPRVVIYDGATHQHGDIGIIVRTSAELADKLKNSNDKILVCQPLKDSQDIFDTYCKVVWEIGNVSLFIEEVGNYCDSYSAGEYFDILARVGRNHGIGLVAINQRPARIWNNFIALIKHWVIFNCELPKDIQFLGEYIGQEKALAVKQLPDRYFYYKTTRKEAIKCNPIKEIKNKTIEEKEYDTKNAEVKK